jgi:beta-glucosidase
MNQEGKFEKFRSNYLDERNEALFPFGYGLSYTNFVYSNWTISSDKMNFNEKITVSVDVANTGNFDGKEVVQLYIRDMWVLLQDLLKN